MSNDPLIFALAPWGIALVLFGVAFSVFAILDEIEKRKNQQKDRRD